MKKPWSLPMDIIDTILDTNGVVVGLVQSKLTASKVMRLRHAKDMKTSINRNNFTCCRST